MISLNLRFFLSIYRAFHERGSRPVCFATLFPTCASSSLEFFHVSLSAERSTDVRSSSRHEPSRRVLSRLCDQSLIEKGPSPSPPYRHPTTSIAAKWKLIPTKYDRQCNLLPLFRRVQLRYSRATRLNRQIKCRGQRARESATGKWRMVVQPPSHVQGNSQWRPRNSDIIRDKRRLSSFFVYLDGPGSLSTPAMCFDLSIH